MGQSFVASRRDNCIQFGGISERPENQAHPNSAGGKNGPPAKAGQVILQCFLLHLKHGLAAKQFPAGKISFLARKTLELSQWQWTNTETRSIMLTV
jgi:hypothetical protein